MIIWIIWLLGLVAAVRLYLRQVYSRFSKYGVKHFKPTPFLGTMGSTLFRHHHFVYDLEKLQKAFPREKFVGKYEFIKPLVTIFDVELVKKITVRDFEHFVDHRSFINEKHDPLFGRNLIALKGQEWKDMRSTLSPAFTSSKIRVMVPFMVEVGEQMIKALQKKLQNSKDDYIDVDVRDVMTRNANDVIASCAFGLKVDSHTEEDNEFFAMGKQAANVTFKQMIVILAHMTMPKLMDKVKLSRHSEAVKNFFRTLVLNTMRERETQRIIRPDMIHLLMEAKKGKLSHDEKSTVEADTGFATVEEHDVGKKKVTREWTDNDLIAQAGLFFIAGFETVSTAMSFLLHELAVNPEVQERLYKEIKETDAKNGGKFDYSSIQQMTYLDMIISETLRMWPPAFQQDRICTKDYNLGKANDEPTTQDYIIRKGEGLSIPTWCFHRNAEYFPEPNKFDPERFSEENKHKIKPFTYMPFGSGPRNCIGSRFALCEVKVMVYQLLQHMELSPGAKTQIPAKVCKNSIGVKIEGGHWVRFRPRK